MRLSTDADRDVQRGVDTLRAALDAGANLLDTAPSYGLGEGDEHHNERLVARVLSELPAARDAVRVVTKAGIVRRGQAWVPDGRAKSLRASCEASLTALGVGSLDLLLLHAPDPRTPLSTSMRALGALQREGLVNAVGLSNPTLPQLEQARSEVDVRAVQVALGAFDDAAFRSGLVARCLELSIEIFAHTPLGGPKRRRKLALDPELAEIARRHGTTAGSIVLAWLYGLHPQLTPLPGARRPETARAAVHAAELSLDAGEREKLDRRFARAARTFGRLPDAPVARRDDAEIVVVLGIQAAGKSEHVSRYAELGYERLNRDLRGGTLVGLASELDRRLQSGGRRFVLDNTYATRTLRSHVIDVARAHGVAARCVWLDTPLEAAQVNAVLRLLARYGRLPAEDEIRALSKSDPNTFFPTVQMSYRRAFEPPTTDEGFAHVERLGFERRAWIGHDQPGLVIALAALHSLPRDRPDKVLGFGWDPDADRGVEAPGVELAVCTHGGGPPRCWCRPPLPGLIVPWLVRERIDPAKSLLIGTGPAHETLAGALGFAYRGIQ